MQFNTLTLGGWYQRTTLHLTEIYDLFARGISKLPLSPEKLLALQKDLDLVFVSRETDYLEYVLAKTSSGIEIKYYEDGLYTLTIKKGEISFQTDLLNKYFAEKFKPATDYIFSLGAPTPKILANLETEHPLVLVIESKTPSKLENLLTKELGPVYNQISSSALTVYKTPQHIVIATSKASSKTNNLVENQIFFREFKDQLEKYLNSHRIIWEKISEIKERKFIKGDKITLLRSELDAYEKTINLINSRLNQMSTYVKTRASITKKQGLAEYLDQLFQYKFETLTDTHAYIKDVWRMTQDYVNQGLKVISELQAESTKDSIRSLQTITTVGVISGLVAHFTRESFPKFTLTGLKFFAFLVIVTLISNLIITFISRNLKYKVKFTQHKSL